MTSDETRGVDLDAVMARLARTTPGVWKLWAMDVMADQDGTSNYATAVRVAATYFRDHRGKPRTWDAEFIALARTDIPALVAEVRVLRDQRDKALASVSTILGESLRAVADGTDPSDAYIDAWPKLVAALTGKDTE